METTRSQEKLRSYLLLLLAHPILRDAQDSALAKLDPEAAQRTASPPPKDSKLGARISLAFTSTTPMAPPPPPG